MVTEMRSCEDLAPQDFQLFVDRISGQKSSLLVGGKQHTCPSIWGFFNREISGVEALVQRKVSVDIKSWGRIS